MFMSEQQNCISYAHNPKNNISLGEWEEFAKKLKFESGTNYIDEVHRYA